jgi:hypothetical protein
MIRAVVSLLLPPLIVVIIFLLFIVWVVKADWSPTIRQLDQTTIDGTDCCILRVYCDAPRGNIVYLSRAWGSTSPGVAVIHQPEMCK